MKDGSPELETVATYTTRSEADVAKAVLRAVGIDAIIHDESEGGLSPGFFSKLVVRLLVKAEDLDEARQRLGD